ncbi:hypothetical protein CS022_21345 [Veronia nyctiphanis]|uniref:Uncharacterized protein n=1 Tax=Veronia nyctiphanis TaxID=1278244 RepID=A0A4Q0YML5_9GAMM|nr:hypothetical protein [Veronia nyctiphanis]RXJ71214.1 hypothetical protein CS022_21345 [Veronia nyctiphanis]
MNVKQVDIHYNSNDSGLYQQLFLPLQSLFSSQLFEDWSVSREWQHGPHYRLLLNTDSHFYSDDLLAQALSRIDDFFTSCPSPELDIDNHRLKQKKLMVIEKVSLDPEMVEQNNTVRVTDTQASKLGQRYESQQQWRSVFEANCRLRPLLLTMGAETSRNADQQRFNLMMLLACIYQPKPSNDPEVGEYNGFLSYHSNFTFWAHSLGASAQTEVEEKFDKKYQQDAGNLTAWLAALQAELQSDNPFLCRYGAWLKAHFLDFTKLVQDGVIHQRSPYPKQKLADIREVSAFHKSHFYTRDGQAFEFPLDFGSYRWLLNIVYRQFPLLNYTPLDRQYFNYCLSRFERENRQQVAQLRAALYQC